MFRTKSEFVTKWIVKIELKIIADRLTQYDYFTTARI